MFERTEKPRLTPPEAASGAGFSGQDDRWPAEPKVWGSSPHGRAKHSKTLRESLELPENLL